MMKIIFSSYDTLINAKAWNDYLEVTEAAAVCHIAKICYQNLMFCLLFQNGDQLYFL